MTTPADIATLQTTAEQAARLVDAYLAQSDTPIPIGITNTDVFLNEAALFDAILNANLPYPDELVDAFTNARDQLSIHITSGDVGLLYKHTPESTAPDDTVLLFGVRLAHGKALIDAKRAGTFIAERMYNKKDRVTTLLDEASVYEGCFKYVLQPTITSESSNNAEAVFAQSTCRQARTTSHWTQPSRSRPTASIAGAGNPLRHYQPQPYTAPSPTLG